MTRYWIKIVIGALLVFAAGMAVWKIFHVGVNTVHLISETSDPITIPLKIVNFRVDGANLGRLERIRLIRSAPNAIQSVEVTARVDSAGAADRLRDCTLRLDDLDNINDQTTFVCASGQAAADSGAFELFGEVRIEGTDVVVPLLLPASTVRDLQHRRPQAADSAALPVVPPVPPVHVESPGHPATGAAESAPGTAAPTP